MKKILLVLALSLILVSNMNVINADNGSVNLNISVEKDSSGNIIINVPNDPIYSTGVTIEVKDPTTGSSLGTFDLNGSGTFKVDSTSGTLVKIAMPSPQSSKSGYSFPKTGVN